MFKMCPFLLFLSQKYVTYVITVISFLEHVNLYYANFSISMVYQWIPTEM